MTGPDVVAAVGEHLAEMRATGHHPCAAPHPWDGARCTRPDGHPGGHTTDGHRSWIEETL